MLLIVQILSDDELRSLLRGARSLGMEALVEVVDGPELARAIAAGATVIGVNNRNLRDFTVDSGKARRVFAQAAAGGLDGKVLLALSGTVAAAGASGRYRRRGSPQASARAWTCRDIVQRVRPAPQPRRFHPL